MWASSTPVVYRSIYNTTANIHYIYTYVYIHTVIHTYGARQSDCALRIYFLVKLHAYEVIMHGCQTAIKVRWSWMFAKQLLKRGGHTWLPNCCWKGGDRAWLSNSCWMWGGHAWLQKNYWTGWVKLSDTFYEGNQRTYDIIAFNIIPNSFVGKTEFHNKNKKSLNALYSI